MIAHNCPTMGTDEMRAANRVIESGWVGQGKEVEGFENELCRYLGIPDGHAVAVSSGTAALYLAIRQLGIERVSYPIYTCSSVRNAIIMANCVPCPKDVDAIDLNIVTHMFGFPNYIQSMKTPFIEDAAQALGAKVNDRFVGTIGDYGVFSFSATKIITSGGQGGAVVSWSRDQIDEIRDFREFDMRDDLKPRFNFQMTDLQAAIGRVQLAKLGRFIERREEIFSKYVMAGLPMLWSKKENIEDVRYRAILITSKARVLVKVLALHGIRAIIPIVESELLGIKEYFPNALELTRSLVSLPIYPNLTDEEVEFIIMVVKECLF